MTSTTPRLEGGACMDLAPAAVQRYFDAPARPGNKDAEVAKKICLECPIQQACLQHALHGPEPTRGVVGGMSAASIRNLRMWENYDRGLIDKEPTSRRPEIPTPRVMAHVAVDDYRRKVDFSFEERVYEVFKGIREQRITKINDAIAQIALIHGDFMGERK